MILPVLFEPRLGSQRLERSNPEACRVRGPQEITRLHLAVHVLVV